MLMGNKTNEFMMTTVPFWEQLHLIRLIHSVQEPSNDPCESNPTGRALYSIARSLDKAAEHLHDAVRRRMTFNAVGWPLLQSRYRNTIRVRLILNIITVQYILHWLK